MRQLANTKRGCGNFPHCRSCRRESLVAIENVQQLDPARSWLICFGERGGDDPGQRGRNRPGFEILEAIRCCGVWRGTENSVLKKP